MPPAAEAWVLDTSALLCYRENEPGAAEVIRLLKAHGSGKIHVSFISMMECYYIVHQEQGESEAGEFITALKQLPLHVVESDEELGLAAGRIKASHRLSVADAWVAATAERLGAVLVHKDPEFEPLKSSLRLHPLPYKN